MLERLPNSLTNLPLKVEFNPIQPELPAAFAELPVDVKEFHQAQTQVLRDQHNKSQAGDSTFPWELLTSLDDTARYTPGSLGRFYHDSMGIILARYVRFTDMVTHAFFCVPVGRLTDASQVSWNVTNDLSKSSAFSVVGLTAALTHPADGQFGWVIISGPNLSSVKTLDSTVDHAKGFAWSGIGEVSAAAEGRVIARVIGAGDRFLAPGQVFIELESMSDQTVKAVLAQQLTTYDMALAGFNDRIATVEAAQGATDTDARFTDVNARLSRIARDLTAETRARISDITELRGLMTGGVTMAQLTSALEGLEVTLNLTIADVRVTANSALAQSTTALSRLDALVTFDPTTLNEAVAALGTRISGLTFGQLADVPDSYVGFGLQLPRIKADESGIEFAAIAGLPVAGSTGQVLRKNSGADYDAGWATLVASDIGFTPSGGLSATDVQAAFVELDSEKIPKVTSTDNGITRYDGTGGLVQDSLATLDDNGVMFVVGFRAVTSRSLASWATVGPLFNTGSSVTLTDTSSVAATVIPQRGANSFTGPAFAASNAITITDAATLIVTAPTAGTNVTITNAYGIILRTGVKMRVGGLGVFDAGIDVTGEVRGDSLRIDGSASSAPLQPVTHKFGISLNGTTYYMLLSDI